MSTHHSGKIKHVRRKRRRWQKEIKTYLAIVFACFLIAAIVSFFRAHAPEIVKNDVSGKPTEPSEE